jgi:hypothetical protein
LRLVTWTFGTSVTEIVYPDASVDTPVAEEGGPLPHGKLELQLEVVILKGCGVPEASW